MAKRLFVGNIKFELVEADLLELFRPHGARKALIVTDPGNGRSRGFGFVEFDREDAAEKAVAAMDGLDVGGRKIVVQPAKPKPAKERPGPRA